MQVKRPNISARDSYRNSQFPEKIKDNAQKNKTFHIKLHELLSISPKAVKHHSHVYIYIGRVFIYK